MPINLWWRSKALSSTTSTRIIVTPYMNGMNSLTLIMWIESSAMKLNNFSHAPLPVGASWGLLVPGTHEVKVGRDSF